MGCSGYSTKTGLKGTPAKLLVDTDLLSKLGKILFRRRRKVTIVIYLMLVYVIQMREGLKLILLYLRWLNRMLMSVHTIQMIDKWG